MNYYMFGSKGICTYESFQVENGDYNFNLFVENKFTRKGKYEEEYTENVTPLSLIQTNTRKRTSEVDFPWSYGNLVSEKAYMLLKELSPNIQFIPALYGDKKYYFMNCYNCYDFEIFNENMSFIKEGDHFSKVFFSLFQFNQDFKEDIFSFKGSPDTIFVSEKVKEIFVKNKVKGANFRKRGYSPLEVSKNELKHDIELIIHETNIGGQNQHILEFMKNEIVLKTNNPNAYDFVVKNKNVLSKNEILKGLILTN